MEEGMGPDQAGVVHSGEKVVMPARETLPSGMTEQQTADKLAEMKKNQTVAAAAINTPGVPGERYAQRFDSTGGNPEIDSVPGVPSKPGTESPVAGPPIINSADVPKV